MAVAYSSWLNGFTGIAVTKLDVLDTFETLQICTGYRVGDQVLDYAPVTSVQKQVVPVYEEWPGWMCDTSGVRTWNELPEAAKKYLRRIEELAGAPIDLVSVGPERDQVIVLDR